MRQIVCKITGKITGTGFLINENQILTAYHVVSGVENVELSFFNLAKQKIVRSATIEDFNREYDIALLNLDQPIQVDIAFWKLSIDMIEESSRWSTFGYPQLREEIGLDINGTINRANITNDDLVQDIDLSYPSIGLEDFAGFSGAPLMIDNVIAGILLKSPLGTLGAISFNKCINFLISNKLVKNRNKITTLKYMENSVKYEFNNRLLINNGWFLVKGNPGLGKTTFLKNFNNLKENLNILGKYYFKDPDELLNIIYKGDYEVIALWIEDTINNALNRGNQPRVERKKYEWITHLSSLFEELNLYYDQKQLKGLLFFDGIDELQPLQVREFFALLPNKIFRNISIILSCQNEIIIPEEYKVLIKNENKFVLKPFEKEVVQKFVYQKIKNKYDSLTLANKISIKSEGHPLYLKYLIDICLESSDIASLHKKLDSMITIEGNIRNYYNILWNKYQQEQDKLYILALISRLREPLNIKEFQDVLSTEYKITFVSFLDEIIHLIKDKQNIFSYHSSFSEFIKERTEFLDYIIHKDISHFCKDNLNNVYSVRNIIHHILLQDDFAKKEVLTYCNQQWVDLGALLHVSPDLLIKDLQKTLIYVIESKVDFSEVIRIILLIHRVKYRYNSSFVSGNLNFLRLLVEQRKFSDVMKYIIRNGNLSLIDNEILKEMMIKLLELSAYEQAELLFETLKSNIIRKFEIKEELMEGDFILYLECFAIITAYNPKKYLDNFMNTLTHIDQQEIYEEIMTLNQAIFIMNNKKYNSLEKLRNIEKAEDLGLKINENMSDILIQTLHHIILYKDLFDINFKKIIEEIIDDIFTEFEKEDSPKYASILFLELFIGYNVKVDEVAKIINKNINKKTPFILREDNGVDLNIQNYYDFYFFNVYQGFLNPQYTPNSIEYINKDWESYIESLIKYIGNLEGKYWRIFSENNGEISDTLYQLDIQQKILDKLILSLEVRVSWERSYFLAEDTFTLLYHQIALLVKRYFPNRIEEFLDFIYLNMDGQLGLYTEGYREIIFKILEVFQKEYRHKLKIFRIIDKLEKYILEGIHNRIERVDELLKVSIAFKKNNNEERSIKSFEYMLNCSMGPNWYKEDQFMLIGTIINHLGHIDNLHNFLPKIEAILNYASGEMTFKRYIRYEQEEFLGHLCKRGFIEDALNLLSINFFVKAPALFERVEKNPIDYVGKGKGYNFGVNNLELENCMLYILESIEGFDDAIKWALTEAIVSNEQRYLERYIKIFTKIIENNFDTPYKETYMNRFKEIYLAKLASGNNNKIRLKCNEKTFDFIVNEFNKINIFDFEIDSSNQDEYTSILTHLKEDIDTALVEIQMQNIELGVKMIVHALEKVQDENISIWSGFWDKEIEFGLITIVENLKPEELIYSLRNLIINNKKHDNEWVIVNKLINLCGEKLGNKEAEKVLNVVINHLSIIVDFPRDFISGYNWSFKTDLSYSNLNIIEYMLGLFDLPLKSIHENLFSSILFITNLIPEIIIPVLIEKTTNRKPIVSFMSLEILKSYNSLKPGSLIQYVESEYFSNKIKTLSSLKAREFFYSIGDIEIEQNNEIDFLNDSTCEEQIEFWKKEVSLISELEKIGVWKMTQYIAFKNEIFNHLEITSINELIYYKECLERAYRIEDINYYFNTMYLSIIDSVLPLRLKTNQISEISSLLDV